MGEKSKLEVLATTIQVLSVVLGVLISVLSFSSAMSKESLARGREAMARITEAEKPLQDLRRTVQERFGRGLPEDGVELLLVAANNISELRRQREDEVEVAGGQKLGFPLLKPPLASDSPSRTH